MLALALSVVLCQEPDAVSGVAEELPMLERPVVLKPSYVPLTEVQRSLLTQERDELGRSMPSVTGPMVLAGLGSVLPMVAFFLMPTATGPASTAVQKRDFTIATSVVLGAGIVSLATGIIWLRERRLAREPYFERIEAIDEELGT